jgi:hypothetical protein
MTSSPMAKMRNDINNEDGQQRLSPEISDRNGQETIMVEKIW